MPSRVAPIFASMLISGAFALACSSSEPAPKTAVEPTDPDAAAKGPSRREGCERSAVARCRRLEGCSPHLLRTTYGGFESCVAREKLACPMYESAGVALTGSDLVTCASEIASTSCDDFLRGALPASCAKPGTLERDAACGADVQCKSGACGTHGKACGTCTLVSYPGDECKIANCAAGSVCLSGSCVKLGRVGASCDAARLPCLAGLACARGRCAEPIRNEETACEPDSSACDTTAGLYCDRETKLCKPVTLAGAGEACGYLNRVFVACDASALCTGGVCAKAASEGDACAADAQCAPPARCLSGKCSVPGVTACESSE